MWRIAKKLGWVPPSASRDQTYDHLNERVPPAVKCAGPPSGCAAEQPETFQHCLCSGERAEPGGLRADDLHVLLVEHGKCCKRCAKNGQPRKEVVGPCPLTDTQALAKQMAADGHDLGAPDRAGAVLSDSLAGAKAKAAGGGAAKREPVAESKPKVEEAEAKPEPDTKPSGGGKAKPAPKARGRTRSKQT